MVDGYQNHREGRVTEGLGKSEDYMEEKQVEEDRGKKKQAVRLEQTKDDLQKAFRVFKE